jgi:hypothetical protein
MLIIILVPRCPLTTNNHTYPTELPVNAILQWDGTGACNNSDDSSGTRTWQPP